jgi:cytidylate kinase
LLRDLRERDLRDTSRAAAPLKPAADAKTLDTSGLSIDQAVEQIIGWYKAVAV